MTTAQQIERLEVTKSMAHQVRRLAQDAYRREPVENRALRDTLDEIGFEATMVACQVNDLRRAVEGVTS